MAKKVENNTGYKDEMKASLLNYISEVSNFGIIMTTAVVTMSLSIFMDLMNSTCNVLRTGICTFLSVKLQKNQTFKYNYGTDNLETVSMLVCEMLLTIGSSAVMIFAISSLFNPTQPSDSLILAVVVKAINVIVGGLILIKCYQTYKKTATKVAKTNFEGTLGSFFFDFAIFLSVLFSYLFIGKGFTVYIQPVSSILIAIFIIYKSIGRIKEYVRELIYVTLEEKDQMKIMKVLANHFHDFEKFFSVNSHKSGKNVYIDFLVSFPKETTYGEIVGSLEEMTKELEETFENCKVSIIFNSNNSLANNIK